jgi:hypothetical protein
MAKIDVVNKPIWLFQEDEIVLLAPGVLLHHYSNHSDIKKGLLKQEYWRVLSIIVKAFSWLAWSDPVLPFCPFWLLGRY